MSEAALQAYLDEFAQVRPARGNWLEPQRRAAIECFRAGGFPTQREEAWKYTDMRLFTKRRFRAAAPADHAAAGDLAARHRFGPGACVELVFVNGHLAPDLSGTPTVARGVRVQSLADAAAGDDALLREHFSQIAGTGKHAFVALNTAFMTDGALIHVPDGAWLEKPIHLLFLSAPGAEPTASYPRNLFLMGENARATIIESYIGGEGAEYFTDAVSEVVLYPGAALEHYKVQIESQQAFHVGGLSIRQERGSRLESHSIALGGLLARNDIGLRLAYEGAEAKLNGLYLAGGRQHLDNQLRIDHEKPHTRSDTNYRGVLDGRGRAVFSGKVVVHAQAQKTDAQQSNSNLLLSNDAEVDTKPELEIYADDVRCSHGASVGQLDQNILFYLRSRAIPEPTARSLLTFAFAADVMRRMTCRPVRERVEFNVAERLPGAGDIREALNSATLDFSEHGSGFQQ